MEVIIILMGGDTVFNSGYGLEMLIEDHFKY